MLNRWQKTGDGPYDNYLKRARFPEWPERMLTGMLGLVFDSNPVIKLPKRIEYMIDHSTIGGDSIQLLMRRIVSEVLLTGRYGLLADISDDGHVVFCGYATESIMNWKSTNQSTPSLCVLSEAYQEKDLDEFSHDYKNQYLVLRDYDGVYSAEKIIDDDIINIEAPTISYIPFVSFGSRDLTLNPDVIPLLPVVMSSLEYYTIHADYRSALYYSAAPQYVVIGVDDDDDSTSAIGPSSVWSLPHGSDAKILEFSGSGTGALRQALIDAEKQAYEAGARVMDKGNVAESGESRRQRRADSQSGIKSVVETMRRGLIKSLEYAADIAAADGDIVIEINTDFDDLSIDAALLTAINNSIVAGNAPQEVLFDYMREVDMTTYTDQELRDLIGMGAGKKLV